LPPIYGTPWGYRQRARLSVRYVEKKSKLLLGFHERKSSFVADMQTCEILPAFDADTVWSRLSTYGAIETTEYLQRIREIEPARVRAHAQLADIDVLATPTTRITAPKAEDVADLVDYRTRNMAIGRNLMLMNLWDFPSLTLPVGKDANGLPIGLQLSSARGTDDRLVCIARAVERVLGTAREVLGDPPLLQPQPPPTS